MTDYDQNPEHADGGYNPTLGGYVQHPNPHLDSDPPDYDVEQAPSFNYSDDPYASEQPGWDSGPSAPGWQTGSNVPTGDVPSYALLNSEAPSYDAPAYEAPGYDAPAYEAPGYDAPSYDAGGYEEPAYEAPAYDAPVYDAGGYEEPAHEAPAYDAPVYEAPSHEAPVYDAAGYEQPAYEAPPYDAPIAETGNWGASHESFDPAAPTFETESWEMPQAPVAKDFVAPAGDDENGSNKSGMGASAFFIGFLCLAIVVVGGAAFFAFKLADRQPAGPSTPEEAVAVMLEALAAEDALGVAESILPSERESLIDPSLALIEELKRVGLLSSDTDLNNINGLDITTNGLTMEISEVGDQIRWVTLNGGTISAVGSSSELPVSDTGIVGDLEDTTDFSVEPVSFAVVEENGSWYPSIWYTVAETARRDADLPRPTISRQPTGSSTPAEAVARFVNAASDMRPSEMLTAMDPVEMRAAYDYSSLFISDLDSAALELRRDLRSDGSTWNLASLDTTVTEDGDKAIVSIDSFVLTGTQGLTEPFAVTLDAGCLTLDTTGDSETLCRGEDGFPDIATNLRVVQRDGKWFVSAAPNLIYPYVDYLRTLETGSIAEFGELIESALDSALNSSELSFSPISPDQPQTWTTSFTVDQFIPAGTPASELSQYLVLEEVPMEFAPQGAIVNLGQIAGLETAVNIDAGSVLVASMLREVAVTDPTIDPNDPNQPVDPNPSPDPAPSIAEPVEAELFPAQAIWSRVDNSTSAVFDINPDAREPLWVAERTDGSATIQITKLANSRETRALKFHEFFGWQRARNIEYPAYANSQYAVVVVGNYIVVSLDPLDDSGILLEQARYLAKQIR